MKLTGCVYNKAAVLATLFFVSVSGFVPNTPWKTSLTTTDLLNLRETPRIYRKTLLTIPKSVSGEGALEETLADDNGGKTTEKPLTKKVKAFALWVVPVLFYIYGLGVSKSIDGIISQAISLQDKANLPPYWRVFTFNQLGDLLIHLRTSVPALALYQAASFFRFPVPMFTNTNKSTNWYYRAAAICDMIAAPLFATSMFFAFKSLPQFDPTRQWISIMVTSVLILVTIPVFPWVFWEVEYGGRTVRNNPTKLFLSKPILAFCSLINVWKIPMFAKLNFNLYQKVLKNILPASWCQAGVDSVQSLVDAGKYSTPNSSETLKTKQGLHNITVGVLFNMLYGVLTGINVLSSVTRFGFFEKTLKTLRLHSGSIQSIAHAGCCPFTMLYAPKAAAFGSNLSLAVGFLLLMFGLLAVWTIYGLAILSVFDAFGAPTSGNENA